MTADTQHTNLTIALALMLPGAVFPPMKVILGTTYRSMRTIELTSDLSVNAFNLMQRQITCSMFMSCLLFSHTLFTIKSNSMSFSVPYSISSTGYLVFSQSQNLLLFLALTSSTLPKKSRSSTQLMKDFNKSRLANHSDSSPISSVISFESYLLALCIHLLGLVPFGTQIKVLGMNSQKSLNGPSSRIFHYSSVQSTIL